MSDPFVAEVRMFAFDFAPKGWAFCTGQLLPLAQNTALFSLLGTTYGGNGKTNFALPDLRGRAVLHPGQGTGQPLYDLGQSGGAQSITLTVAQMPSHAHSLMASSTPGNDASPQNKVLAQAMVYALPDDLATTSSQSIQPSGGSLAHDNMMPYLALNFCIALTGVFPTRP